MRFRVGIVSLLLLVAIPAWGFIRTTFTHTAVNVLHTASTATVAASLTRNYLLLQNNNGTNRVWCKFGADAVVNEGFRLNTGGDPVIFDNAIPTAAVNCLAETGTTVILVTEGNQ